jgi:hypothetical protein
VNKQHPMRLRNPDADIPARGWAARQPETGRVLQSGTLRTLTRDVLVYRTANNLPVEPNIRRQVETQVCGTMSESDSARYCVFLNDDDAKNPVKLRQHRSTITDLENFGKAVKAVLETAASQEALHVSQEEADRRGSICASCPKNLPIANCWGCGTLGSIYRSILGRQSSAHDHRLHSCDVCGCDNKTQVHFTGRVLRLAAEKQGIMDAEFPNWCWKREVLSDA